MVEHCTREKEIDELKAEVGRLRDLQYTDHDLLIKLDVKMDSMSIILAQLVSKVEYLANQPANSFNKLKIAGASSLVGAIIAYLFSMLIQ